MNIIWSLRFLLLMLCRAYAADKLLTVGAAVGVGLGGVLIFFTYLPRPGSRTLERGWATGMPRSRAIISVRVIGRDEAGAGVG